MNFYSDWITNYSNFIKYFISTFFDYIKKKLVFIIMNIHSIIFVI